MLENPWQLRTPIDAVIFDCDGTLSSIEGIDELAKLNHVGDIVQRLTAEAMGASGMSQILYEERLTLVKPTHEQTLRIGQLYIQHQAPLIAPVLAALKRLNKAIYIVSAGLLPAVAILGKFFNVPLENIFAVDILFDKQGHYQDFDRLSPMTQKDGKRAIIHQIKKSHTKVIFMGDGLSDYEAYDLVERFIGYGGAYYRQQIEEHCDFYCKTASMAFLLPLALTLRESEQLSAIEIEIYQSGLEDIQHHRIKVPL